MHSAKATLPLAKPLPRATLGKKSVVKEFFAESFLSGTRQSLCQEQSRLLTKKSGRHGAGSINACFASAMSEALGKDFLIF